MRKRIFFIFLFFSVAGCMDQCERKKNIPGNYFLSESGPNEWDLYYDLDNSSGIGRIMGLKQIGWTDKYIFATDGKKYFFLDKTKDNQFLNSSEIVKGPLMYNQYNTLLDSLGVKDFKLHKP